MRARNLKPGFFKNEDLAQIGFAGQLLFEGLWCLADRDGRLEDRPLRIQAEIFPYPFQGADVEGLLAQLAASEDPFIIRYAVGRKRFIQIANFHVHQNPHPRETISEIPSPPRHDQGNAKDMTGPADVPFPDISHSLNPHSLTPHYPKGSDESEKPSVPNGNGLTTSPLPANAEATPFPLAERFEQIWNYYPRRLGRKTAWRHFKTSVTSEDAWRDIQQALTNYLAKLKSEKTEPKYIQHGSTWFNNWRDFVDLEPTSIEAGGKPKWM